MSTKKANTSVVPSTNPTDEELQEMAKKVVEDAISGKLVAKDVLPGIEQVPWQERQAAKEVMARATMAICLNIPYFAPLISMLPEVETVDMPTAATDGRHLFYNPQFINTLSDVGVTCVKLHEILHAAYCHVYRLAGRHHEVANIAMDFVVNRDIESLNKSNHMFNLTLPKEFIQPNPEFQNWSYEEVYDYLMKNKNNLTMPKIFDMVQQPPTSGAGGAGDTLADYLDAQERWKKALQQAATLAKQLNAGNMPGWLSEIIKGQEDTHIDWYERLRDFVNRRTREKNTSTWNRFNRRFIGSGLYLPGSENFKLGRVVCFLDTSGSMGHDSFKKAVGAFGEIAQAVSFEEMVVAQVDTVMQKIDYLLPHDLPLPEYGISGRGGTILQPAFEWLASEYSTEDVDFVLVITDGYCDTVELPTHWPKQWKILWLYTTNCPFQQKVGDYVKVD